MTAPGSDPGFESPVVAAISAPSRLRGETQPTEHEYEALRAVVRLSGYVPAAYALGVSLGTIKRYLEHLRAWHRADNTTHLAALVMRDIGDIFDWQAPA